MPTTRAIDVLGCSYGLALFLGGFLGLSLSSLSTPAPNSLFTPGFRVDKPSCLISLTGDATGALPFDGDVLSGSDLICADVAGSSGGTVVDVDRGDFFGWLDLRTICSWGKRESLSLDNLRLTILLGFDGLIGLALFVAIGVAVVGGFETFDSELETRRGTVVVLEPGAMVLSWSLDCPRCTSFVEGGGLLLPLIAEIAT